MLETLLYLGQEVRLLIMMNDTGSESVADSIANRLTLTLTELVTIDSSLSGRDARQEIMELLSPIVHHELEDVRAIGHGDEIINLNPPGSTDEPLTTFIRRDSLSSSGFTVTWGRYKNIHRYWNGTC